MKIRFNLAWILAFPAAFLLAAMAFLSFYYRSGGSLLLPSLVAAGLFILPIIVSSFLSAAKSCDRPCSFHTKAQHEVIALTATLLLFIASLPLIDHFFTVNSRVDTIASSVAELQEVNKDMFESYKRHVDQRVKSYEAYLREVDKHKQLDINKWNATFPNGSADISAMAQTLRGKISCKLADDSVSRVFDDKKVSWWRLPSLMNNVESLSRAVQSNYDLLQRCDHKDSTNMAPEDYWTYNVPSNSDIMRIFTSTKGFVSHFWTVLASLIAFLVILLPYWSEERNYRSKGLFAEFANDKQDQDSDAPHIGHV